MTIKRLGDIELEIFNIVCRLEEASVKDVVAEISRKRHTAYTSVMTLMKNLAEKGYLEFKQVGKKYVYYPAIQPTELRQNLLEITIDKVFGGSAVDLVQSLVKSEKISKQELGEIRKLLNEMEEK